MITHATTRDTELERAYKAGFIEATRWNGAVSQDVDSPFLERRMREYIEHMDVTRGNPPPPDANRGRPAR